MKHTITKTLCDCCGKELTGNEGTSQFREEYIGVVKIKNHHSGKEIRDICFVCNDAILNVIWQRSIDNTENTH